MKKIISYFLISMMLIYSTNTYAWWNCSWTSRIPIGIKNSGAAQSNYVVEIRFTSSTVSNYNWNNLDKDLRFIDADDSTQLKFFVMPRTTTSQEVLVWVSIPVVPAGTKTIFMYYNNTSAISASSPTGVLVSGIRMYTKGSTNQPSSYNSWWNAFDSATAGQSGYGCKILTDMTSINNAGQFTSGSAANILFSYVTVLTANSSGTWQFRHGADYGWGGGIYQNSIALQEKYGTDIWWNNSWTDTTQILTGSWAGTSGSYYVLRSYGGEGGADGVEQLQISAPSGGFKVMTTGNFTLNAPPCESPTVTKVVNSPLTVIPTLNKIVAPFSDSVNGTTNPKMIPNARVRYTITMTSDNAIGIDLGSVNITDAIPTNTKMYVGDLGATGSGPIIFTDGSPASGLTYSSSTNLKFSKDNGATWNYTPVADNQITDSTITNIKINPSGSIACTTGTTKPSFSLSFDVLIK